MLCYIDCATRRCILTSTSLVDCKLHNKRHEARVETEAQGLQEGIRLVRRREYESLFACVGEVRNTQSSAFRNYPHDAPPRFTCHGPKWKPTILSIDLLETMGLQELADVNPRGISCVYILRTQPLTARYIAQSVCYYTRAGSWHVCPPDYLLAHGRMSEAPEAVRLVRG